MTQLNSIPRIQNDTRIVPVNFPSYHYPHPSIQTLKLATVKEGMFHPSLPTFRRMDMDTSLGRLCDEHCSTTTKCSRDDFQLARTSMFGERPLRLNSLAYTETGKLIHKHFTAPDELRCARIGWSEFLNRCPERYKIRLSEPFESCCGNLEFSGYAVRYLKPSITQAWKRPLDRYIPSASTTSCERCSNRRSRLPF